MRRLRFLTVSILVSALALASVFVFRDSPKGKEQSVRTAPAASSKQGSPAVAKTTFTGLPLSFFPNRGQTDAETAFMSVGANFGLHLTSREAVLSFAGQEPPPLTAHAGHGARQVPRPAQARLRWLGANPNPRVTGMEELPGKVNCLTGNDPARWRSNLPSYERVRYEDVWPGIDLVFYGNARCLEYDFVVSAGADPNAIRLAFPGAERLELDEAGDVLLHTAGEAIRQRRPVVYQETRAGRQVVEGRYVITEDANVAFRLGSYDPTLPVVIDPMLVFSTYLGGNNGDLSNAVVADDGSLFVSGATNSTNFPTGAPTPEAPFQIVLGGTPTSASDVFISKLAADGSAIIYSTYLGGSSGDHPFGIALDQDGSVVVAGMTLSSDFPTQAPLQGTLNGGQDLFVARLNATGSGLLYSTYVGGSGADGNSNMSLGRGALALDAGGRAHVFSTTLSGDFPTTPNAYLSTQQASSGDGCLVVLNAAGSAIDYATYFGGSGNEEGALGIQVDAAGDIYLSGVTGSADFPTAPAVPLDGTYGGNGDLFVSKLHVTGSGTTLVYSTYLGGSGAEFTVVAAGPELAVDAAGRAHVRVSTNSVDFPTVNAAQPALAGGVDVAVARLNPAGTALEFSTYLGGSGPESAAGIAVDPGGYVYVVGRTNSSDFPTQNASGSLSGTIDAFVAMYTPQGVPVYVTYLGGSADDFARAVAADGNHIYVVGFTASTDFPTVNPLQGNLPGQDAFIAKIGDLFGSVTGQVVANPNSPGTPLVGVVVDAFLVGHGHLLGSAVTDANGIYLIPRLPPGDYIITVVTPLGYSVAVHELAATVAGGDTVALDSDFVALSVPTAGTPRSIGFWKHQVGVATGGKGTAQIGPTTLCEQLDLIEAHFNHNALNQVVVYDPPGGATCGQKLETAKVLLNLHGSNGMIHRAR